MKHSPGPWRVYYRSAATPPDDRTVLEVGSPGRIVLRSEGYPVTIDDAKLIAAAPEMLELLRDSQWFPDSDYGPSCISCHQARRDHGDKDCALSLLLERLK